MPQSGPGRPSVLDSTDTVEEFAEAWAAGATRAELAEMFKVTKQTITKWTQRDDVKEAAKKIIGDRALKVKRKTDTQIENLLENPEELTVDEILKIRKAFAPDVPQDATMTDEEMIAKAMALLDENPEKAEQWQREGIPDGAPA